MHNVCYVWLSGVVVVCGESLCRALCVMYIV